MLPRSLWHGQQPLSIVPDENLECVVLNACYADIQGNAIAAYVPIPIGLRDQSADILVLRKKGQPIGIN